MPSLQQYSNQQQNYPQQYAKAARASSQSQPAKSPLHFLDTRIIMPMIVIIVLLFFGFGVYSYFKSTGTSEAYATEKAPPSLTPTIPAPVQKTDREIIAAAIKATNPADCERAASSEQRDVCYRGIALKTSNPDLCRKMNTKEGPSSEPECVTRIALENDDFDLCFRTGTIQGEYSQTHCLFQQITKQDDPEMCSLISLGEEPYTEQACRQKIAAANP